MKPPIFFDCATVKDTAEGKVRIRLQAGEPLRTVAELECWPGTALSLALTIAGGIDRSARELIK